MEQLKNQKNILPTTKEWRPLMSFAIANNMLTLVEILLFVTSQYAIACN